MDNGFEIELLNQLVHDCPCEHHERTEDKGALHAAFIKKHRNQLENYSTEAYAEYIRRIDRELLRRILNRHIREQLFKDYKAGLSSTGLPKERAIKQQKIEYQRICDDNLRFIDSLARKNIFLGERNLGIYTEKLAKALKITPVAQQRVLMVTFYGLPASTYVPNNSEVDYFGINPVYNMLFHNARSFGVLSPYSSEAIRRGYLHPREYASLAYNRPGARDTSMLLTACPEVNSAKEVNDSRRDFLLPPYEVDYQKRLFAHNHNLQLFFGFRGYEK